VYHFFVFQGLDDCGLADVLVAPVAQPEVVALAPRPHFAALRQGERELSAALDLDHVERVESFDVVRDVAAFGAAAAQLAEVAVAPREHKALVGEGEGLGVAAAARHLDYPVAGQSFHLKHSKINISSSLTSTENLPIWV
jgi:hypothetical protein